MGPVDGTPVAAAPAVSTDHGSMARELVGESHARGGLAPLDLERFWADQEVATKDPFGATIPQLPLRILMSWECVFDELGVQEDHWRFLNDDAWANELTQAYNERSERIVGRRLLACREPKAPDDTWPSCKWLHDIFEARNVWHGNSWWLQQAASTEDELAALLDRVDQRLANLRAFVLPPEWDQRKADLIARGIKPPLYRHQRGPVTFATSVYGAGNLMFLLMVSPALAQRLRDTILRAMLALAELLDTEAGYTRQTAPRGFSFADDNCALLSPELYEFFGYPILKGMFDRYSPAPGDWRYQHSDSAMGHLLPVLGRLKLSQVNFGPTLTVSEIRQHMPRTIIEGQLAPFTFSRNQEEGIVAEFLRDFDMAREHRGLYFGTAGSINNGSRLSGMRLVMAAIQKWGRFDHGRGGHTQ